MSKYTKDDPEVKDFNKFDRVNYENYLLNYDVDANTEMAKSADTITQIRDSMKGGPKFQVNDFKSIYSTIFLWFMVVLIMLIVMLVVGMIITIIVWIIKRDELSKLIIQVCLIMLVVILLMYIVISRMTKLNDDVQAYIEKILYRLK